VIATLDTNFLASGLIAVVGGTIASIVELWRAGRFDVRLSQHIHDELTRTLSQPYFTDRVPADAITRYLSFVAQHATLYPITVTITGVATHPEDDLVLATALSAGADYLVTGDRRFRARVPRYQGVIVISPADFLIILGAP
jgi:putative PIN family toxin of toxin-antitoxin system